jgi:DNA-binding SARP family transcriptional activator
VVAPGASASERGTLAAGDGLYEEMRVEFRVLGALEVSTGGRLLDLGGARQQIVLAVLVLNANNSVSQDRLVEAIYDEDPPATARA